MTTPTMTERARVLFAALALMACSEAAAPPAASAGEGESLFAERSDRQWRLPGRLREISGLAVAPDGRLFGHDDEVAVVYELDLEAGRIVKGFAVGDPIERRDFEGIAITPAGDFYLVTSTGRVLSFREGAEAEQVAFEGSNLRIEDDCEVEGLAYSSTTESLILACKTLHGRDMKNMTALYAWTPGSREARPWLVLPEEPLADAVGLDELRPSGVEIDPATGRIVLIAAAGRALLELDADGKLLAARRLDSIHRQVEGVAILPDGSLAIADEGGAGRALLTRYPRR
jgi:uncharacterized protein YjiK